MRRHGFTLIEVFALVAIIAIALCLLPVFSGTHCGNPRRAACQSNLKQVGLGFAQYAQDANERLPRAAFLDRPGTVPHSHAYGWADVIQPYLKNVAIYQCPTQCPTEVEPPSAEDDPMAFGYSDYWFNSRLSGVGWGEITSSATTFLAGDGNDGNDATNARYSYARLPLSWRTDESKPSSRHLDGANYLFADGHVKWLKPENVTTAPTDGTNYTFVVK